MSSSQTCKFTADTKNYLTTFYCILDTMIRDMTTVSLSDSISYNFIVQMIPHHQAAIDMSQNLLPYTTWEPLKKIAERIIIEQTKSIDQMMAILDNSLSYCNSNEDLCLYQRRTNQILDTMFFDMDMACATNQINANFIREMIPHHEGAVRMSRNALRYDINPDLCPILEAIISSQERGIRQMKQLLRCFS